MNRNIQVKYPSLSILFYYILSEKLEFYLKII